MSCWSAVSLESISDSLIMAVLTKPGSVLGEQQKIYQWFLTVESNYCPGILSPNSSIKFTMMFKSSFSRSNGTLGGKIYW